MGRVPHRRGLSRRLRHAAELTSVGVYQYSS